VIENSRRFLVGRRVAVARSAQTIGAGEIMKAIALTAAATIAATVALALGASDAQAQKCMAVSARSNIPTGAIVLKRSGDNPIGHLLTSVGEYNTHVMLKAYDGWFTHDTTVQPRTRSVSFSSPLGPCSAGPFNVNDLKYGRPGVSTIGSGGMYAQVYGADGVVESAYYVNSADYNQGLGLVSAVWNQLSWYTQTSASDSTQQIYRHGIGSTMIGYELYQFRDIGTVHTGGLGATAQGMVCSTFIAHMQYRAGLTPIQPAIYNYSELVNGLQVLATKTTQDCKNSTGGDGWLLAGDFVCDVCQDAGEQLRNCMGFAKCDTDKYDYMQSLINAGTGNARSISPDRLAGTTSRHWADTSNTSVYKNQPAQTIYWNQPGTDYSCYF
jgi:hypothetical protein